jgi:hypothetical protein
VIRKKLFRRIKLNKVKIPQAALLSPLLVTALLLVFVSFVELVPFVLALAASMPVLPPVLLAVLSALAVLLLLDVVLAPPRKSVTYQPDPLS